MTTLTLDEPMADEKPKTLSVKLPLDVIESARIVSAYRNVPIADMLGDILRPILAGMEREERAKRERAFKDHEDMQAITQGPKRKKGGAR